jgi:2-polyprenyl-3-methyl-5-hydroxy-6-metoxy-1,4-benzoquinol methylase
MTDAQPVKDSQRLVWSLGDYRELARQFEPAAVALVEACGVEPGMEVLDVAAGTGNLAVAAARRGARVVASDLTPRMVELGRERSAAEGLDIEWGEADAEDLPFEDGRFDVAASTSGPCSPPAPRSRPPSCSGWSAPAARWAWRT